MNIRDLFPSKEQANNIKDIESVLLSRKTNGKIAGGLAVASALVQITILLWPFLKKIIDASYKFDYQWYLNDPKKLIPLVLLVITVFIYLILRRTSVFLKETKEPFRYTFCVKAFKPVENTPGERFKLEDGDRFNLLHHDLTELINQRIKRFSILHDFTEKKDDVNTISSLDKRKSSHIDIFGFYAIREDKKDGDWIIHVMPYIRIGPPDAPATLAQSIRFPLSTDDSPEKLDTHEYNQLLERVYSRVTTEIYAQIEKDIKNKIRLFPTRYLKANALYHEARDMANSNTINAFESAINLYEEAIRIINLTLVERISGFFLKVPLLRNIFVRYLFQYARIHIGHAKCLVYKNRIAALSGKKRNPVFVIRQNLKGIIKDLEFYHYYISKGPGISDFKNDSNTFSILAYLTYPADTFLRRISGKPSQPLFNETRVILFNAYVVQSLTDTLLNAFISARKFLNQAKAIAPDLINSDPLYFLAQAYTEPNIDRAIFLLQKATELAPSFQIAQYDLAFWMEMKFRLNDEITYNRARSALDEYDRVLRINPGNIAALAAQGYIFWLLHDLDKARRKFEEGYEIKAMVSETFIGQLIYGRARIFAEQGKLNECFDLFNQAFATNPNVGTYSIGNDSWMTYSFYDYISPGLLTRFQNYFEMFRAYKSNDLFPIGTIGIEFQAALDKGELTNELKDSLKRTGFNLTDPKATLITGKPSENWIIRSGTQDILYIHKKETGLQIYIRPEVSNKISYAVFCLIKNDYGNANYNYFRRYGDQDYLDLAVNAYTESIERFRDNTVAKYNKSLAIFEQDSDASIKLLDDVIKNNPKWFEALASSVEINLTKINKEIKTIEKELKGLEEDQILKKENLRKVLSAEVQSLKSMPGDISEVNTMGTSNSPANQQKENIYYEKNIMSSLGASAFGVNQTQKIPAINNDAEIRKIEQKILDLKKNITLKQSKKRELWPKIRNIMEPTKLVSLYDGMQLETLDKNKIENFISNRINWIRLDEDDVRALRIYASRVYYEVSDNDDDRIQTCEKLFDLLLTNYFPEDYYIYLLKKELINRISNENQPSQDICNEIIESSLSYWLEQDTANFYLYTLAKDNIRPELYFGFLERAIRLEKNPELLNLFRPDEYFKIGRSRDEYLELFKTFNEFNPDPRKSAIVYNRMGNSLAELKYLQEAIELQKRSVEYDKTVPDYFYDLGLSYSELGDWDNTLTCCRQALQLKKKAAEPTTGLLQYYRLLSEASFKTDKLKDFIKDFEASGDLNDLPENKATIYNLLGNLLANSDKRKEALKYYDKVLNLDNTKAIYYCNLGLTYAKLDQWGDALKNYFKAIEIRRNEPDDFYGLDYYYGFLSEAYINMGSLDDFLDIFERSGDLADKPDKKAVVYNRLANILANSDKKLEAIQYYKKVIELDETRPIYYCNLGLTYAKLGQWPEAIKYYKQAIDLRKKSPDDAYGLDYYYEFLAEAYFKTDNLQEFLDIYDSSDDMRDSPEKKAIVYNRIANMFAHSENHQKAIEFYEKVISLDADNPIYFCNIGLSQGKVGQWPESIKNHEKAIELRKKRPSDQYGLDYYYGFLAEASFKTGKLNKFMEDFESSGDLNEKPDKKAVIYNQIGNLLANSGKKAEAVDYYRKVIALDACKPIYYCNLGLTFSDLDLFDEATKNFLQAIELCRKMPDDPYGLDYYYEFLSENYFRNDKLNEFLENFESSGDFKDQPEKKAVIYNRIGNLLVNSENKQEAIQYYNKATGLDPDRPIYFCNLGYAFGKLGQWDEAVKFHQNAVDRRKRSTDDTYGFDYYYGFLSEACFRTDKIDEFLAKFEISEDFKDNPVGKAIVYNQIANLLTNSDQEQKAILLYEKAIDHDAARPIYYCNLGLTLGRLGQWEKALNNHTKAVEMRMKSPEDPYSFEYYNDILNEAKKNAAVKV